MVNSLSFQLSDDSRELFVTKTGDNAEMTSGELQQAFNASKYSAFKLNLHAVEEIIAQFNDSSTQATDHICIAKREDADIAITIAKDGMSAEATLTAPHGGKPLSLYDMVLKLKEASVQKGFIKNNLDLIVQKSQELAPGSRVRMVVARGKAPIHGTDSRFEPLVPTAKDRILQPQQLDGGKVDMRNLGEIYSVNIGAPLMRRHPHQDGEAGYKVSGEVLSPKAGKEIKLNPGPGSEISPEDPNLLISTAQGLPRVIDNGMTTEEVYQVKEVTAATGNIYFDGSVVITGDVSEGMTVEANGDITIAGLVESAHLIASGDIAVAKGIIGRKDKSEQLSCLVEAKGSITTKFGQYAQFKAGKDLTVSNQLLHCHADVDGEVLVSNPSGSRGTLLGGSITAGKTITAVTLGAKVVNSTRLNISGPLEGLQQQKKQLTDQLTEHQKMYEQTMAAKDKVDKLPDGEKKLRLITRLNASLDHFNLSRVELQQQLLDHDDQIDTFYQQAKVISLKELLPGVEISIASNQRKTTDRYGRCTAQIRDCQLSIFSIK